MPRLPRTAAEKIDAMQHIGYEVETCGETSAKLAMRPTDPVVRVALLESMLLHARTMTSFLIESARHPYPTDIIRQDFAEEWTPAPTDAAARMREAQPVIHRHLAHLTWLRVDDRYAWDPLGIAQDVLDVTSAWHDHVAQTDAAVVVPLTAGIERARRALGR